MNNKTVALPAAGLGAAALGAMIALPASAGANVLLILLAALMFAAIGSAMRTSADGGWLFKWVLLGFAAKVVRTLARHE